MINTDQVEFRHLRAVWPCLGGISLHIVLPSHLPEWQGWVLAARFIACIFLDKTHTLKSHQSIFLQCQLPCPHCGTYPHIFLCAYIIAPPNYPPSSVWISWYLSPDIDLFNMLEFLVFSPHFPFLYYSLSPRWDYMPRHIHLFFCIDMWHTLAISSVYIFWPFGSLSLFSISIFSNSPHVVARLRRFANFLSKLRRFLNNDMSRTTWDFGSCAMAVAMWSWFDTFHFIVSSFSLRHWFLPGILQGRFRVNRGWSSWFVLH